MHVGSTQANLLLPLYARGGVAALALAWELFGENCGRARQPARSHGRSRRSSAGTRCLLWSQDVTRRGDRVALLRAPFGLLVLALARLPWSKGWVIGLFAQSAAMALVFASIGIVQYDPDGQAALGHAWYQTAVDLTADQAQGKLHLRFPGLFNECWLYVNGEMVAHREFKGVWWMNDYRFEWDVDLAGKLKPGRTRSSLRINNPHHMGGMFRRPFIYRAP